MFWGGGCADEYARLSFNQEMEDAVEDVRVVRYAQKSINNKNGLLVPRMGKAGSPCLHTFVTRLLTGLIGGRLKWPYGTSFSPLVLSSALSQHVDNALRNHKHHVNQ